MVPPRSTHFRKSRPRRWGSCVIPWLLATSTIGPSKSMFCTTSLSPITSTVPCSVRIVMLMTCSFPLQVNRRLVVLQKLECRVAIALHRDQGARGCRVVEVEDIVQRDAHSGQASLQHRDLARLQTGLALK